MAGAWWLLHGLASLGSLGSGGYATQAIAAARAPEGEPPWLGLVPLNPATGKVHELRDTWGLRFGVIAEFAYPGGVDPHVYLLDVDANWDIRIAGAGVFDGVPAAEAAWRAALPPGESAGVGGPVTMPATAHLLSPRRAARAGPRKRLPYQNDDNQLSPLQVVARVGIRRTHRLSGGGTDGDDGTGTAGTAAR